MTETELRHLIGQRLAVGFEGTSIPEEYAALVHDWKIGNVILFRRNIESFEQIRHLNQELRELIAQETGLEPYIMLDEECGSVSRLGAIAVTTPCAMAIGAVDSEENAYTVGHLLGEELRAAGINLDLAPVLDVARDPAKTFLGSRIISSDEQRAARIGCACIEGLQNGGCLSVVKHFPGHGDTQADTHFGYAVSGKSWEEMKACEMIPFRAGISAGAKMIMTAHVCLPNVTGSSTPSTLSPMVLTEILRGRLGYQGIIITDSMEMGAITQQYTNEEATLLALEAGVDILLTPQDYPKAFDAVMKAVEDKRISVQMIDERVSRILALKKELLLSRDLYKEM